MSAQRWWGLGVLGAVVALAVGASGWSEGATALAPHAARAAAPSVPAAPSARSAVRGPELVTRTYDLAPRPAVYDMADGYTAGTAPGQRLTFSVPRGRVILSVGTRVRLTWAGYSADLPDAMGTDIAAQAVLVHDLHPVRLDRWSLEVVNPYLDCWTIPDRVTSVDCSGWRVRLVVTAVVADAAA